MIDPKKLQAAKDLVASCAALTDATAEQVTAVTDAVDAMVAAVASGKPQEHIHTGLLNATVREVSGKILVRVNSTTKGGKPKMAEVHVN